MSEPEERIFTRSVASQLAAGTVIETARKAGFIDGPIIVASELAESEKALIVKILAAIRERGSTELDSDTVSSMFTFVFARAAEAVCSCLNHREFEIEMLGLFDGKTPFYADEVLTGYFKQLNFPTECARRFWEWFHNGGGSGCGADPLLLLAEALKWCFRLSCHIAMEKLESR